MELEVEIFLYSVSKRLEKVFLAPYSLGYLASRYIMYSMKWLIYIFIESLRFGKKETQIVRIVSSALM